MTCFSKFVFRSCALAAALLVVAGGLVGTVSAQTGPGGVGTSDGTSDLKLWLRAADLTASDGAPISTWPDVSGYGNGATQSTAANQPAFSSSAGPSGGAAVVFDPSSGEQYLNGPISKSDALTIFALYSHKSGSVTNGTILEVHDGGDNTSGTRNILQARVGESALAYFDGSNTLTGTSSYVGGTAVIHGATHVGTNVNMYQDGESVFSSTSQDANGSATAYRLGNDMTGGNTIEGEAVEVVAYDRVLNAAERPIVENYLSAKYGVGLAAGDKFAHDGTHGNDVVGIGQASNGDQHLEAESAQLRIEASGSNLGNGDFLLIGHDNQALSFTSTNPNGDPNAQKVGREWRADLNPTLTGSSETQTVDVTVDLSSLSLPSGTNDYGLFVDDDDDDGDFTSGATFYDIDKSTGQAVDVEIGDDDYVTIGAVKRTVQFASANGAGFENAGGGNLGDASSPDLNVTLNYPTNTDIAGIPYDVAEVTSTLNEDTDENFGNEGTNGQEDYRRVNDTFTFPASAGTGPFNFNTESAIAANGTALVVLNDGRDASSDSDESSPEDLDVSLTGSFPSEVAAAEVAAGGTPTHTFSINDDDDPRKVSFSGTTGKPVSTVSVNPEEDSDLNGDILSGEENAVATVTFEVALPSGETGSASTFAVFEVTGAGTGDFDIPANGDNNKLTERRGEVKVPAGARYATFGLTITDESVFENDETLTVELTSARSATLDPSGDANLDFGYTVLNDDTEPTVAFASSTANGGEGTSNVIATLQLSSASELDLDVDFNVTGTAVGGDDYSQNTASPLTIDAGDTEGEIYFRVEEDTTLEANETIEVTINDNATTDSPVGNPSTFIYTIEDNDDLGSTGPAGVASANGSGPLALWLRAESITGVSDGGDVSAWPDASGNGNAAATGSIPEGGAANAPSYLKSGGPNGGPAIEFDASNGEALVGTVSKDGPVTIYAAYSHSSGASAPGTVLELHDDGGTGRNLIQARPSNGGNVVYFEGNNNITGGSGYGGDAVFIQGVRHQGGEVVSYKDGAPNIVTNADDPAITDSYVLANDRTDGNEVDGVITEILVFRTALNETNHTLIENYLAAKYDISLDTGNGATDVYAGDQNGDYDRGVFGIGQEASADFHNAAETDGLRFEAGGGLSNGDYLVAGHRTPSNSVNTADVGGVNGLEGRSERTWFVDKTGSPTADVTISLSEAGLTGPAGDPANYVLITRSDTTGGANWTTAGGTPTVANGDEITFSGVSLSDEHEITLATTNRTDSPLNTSNLVITGTDGTDGADQGWRYMGLPATGGTAADLLDADGNPYINFSVAMAQTNDGGDGSGSGWAPITDPSTALTNGRGFILWLYDSPQYPVDPSVTLQTASGLTAPGNSDVVVGNGPIDEDPSLNQSDEFFMLANPYATPYDLGSLGSASDGFDDNMKVWSPNATTPSGQDDGNAGTFTNRSRSGGDDVASWQGFLAVRSSTGSGNTSLTFGSAGRDPGATVDFVGSKSGKTDAPTQHRVPLRLVGRDAEGALVALDRAASVLFRKGTSTGRDRFDSPKMEPMTSAHATIAPVVSTEGEPALRSAESRPLPSGNEVTVPLAFQRKNVGGTFTIAMPAGGDLSTRTPSYPSDWTVTLIDTKGTSEAADDVTQPLTPGGSGYTFEAGTSTSASAATAKSRSAEAMPPEPRLRRLTLPRDTTAKASGGAASSTRFQLRIDATGSALPVEMAGLSAQREDRRAVLQWATASEVNNAGFTVQHQHLPANDTTATPSSGDWTDLGFVEGAGTTAERTTYRFRTDALGYGRHVFRLRQVDTNGTATVTDRVDVEIRLKKRYAVEPPYPNPARQQAQLPVTVKAGQRVTVEVYDLLGRRVHVVRDRELRGQETKLISLPVRTLSSGAYFVRVRGKQFATTQRLMVVH